MELPRRFDARAVGPARRTAVEQSGAAVFVRLLNAFMGMDWLANLPIPSARQREDRHPDAHYYTKHQSDQDLAFYLPSP